MAVNIIHAQWKTIFVVYFAPLFISSRGLQFPIGPGLSFCLFRQYVPEGHDADIARTVFHTSTVSGELLIAG